MKLQFKNNIKGFKYSSEEGTIEEVYTEGLDVNEVAAFNKFSEDEAIFCDIQDVVDSFGIEEVEDLEGWGLDEVVEEVL